MSDDPVLSLALHQIEWHPIEMRTEMKTSRRRAKCPLCPFSATGQSVAAVQAHTLAHDEWHMRRLQTPVESSHTDSRS